MSDDASTSAIHAQVAAKLKRAGSLAIGVNGDAPGPSNKRPNRAVTTTTNGAGSAAPPASGTRKLLHWSPEQWRAFEGAPLFAKLIAPAKILPIRAPLSSIYEIHYADEKATYTPSALMEKLLAASRSGPVTNVGLVIDASGSEYFKHDVKEWDDWDVQFLKLRVALPGEDATDEERKKAEDAMVAQFFSQVEKHKAGEIKDMDIAVFGADGSDYNFVGFLVVSYLVEYCDMNLDAALKEYAASFAPGVYSRYYLERLYRKYFSTLPSMASTVKCPPAPKWDTLTQSEGDAGAKIGSSILTEEDQQHKFVRKVKPRGSLSTPTAASTAFSATSTTPTGLSTPSTMAPPTYKPPLYIPPVREDDNARPSKRRKIRSWVDDVEPLEFGETLDPSSEEHAKVLGELEKLTGHEGFPGCEAIPLTGTHIGADGHKKRGCLTHAYFVTWRARGRRCMLFIAESGTYVVSRNTTFTKVNMKFPRRRALNESHVNTLIDGIIVEDQDHDVKVARFLAFDIAFLEGTPIWQKKLEKRLQCLQNEIILPRKNDQSFDYNTEPFRVRMKDHFKLSKTEFLLTKFVRDVTHEVDGVVFTPLEAPYNLGGFESEDPIFKFVASEGSGIPGLDGSISQRRLLQYIQAIPPK